MAYRSTLLLQKLLLHGPSLPGKAGPIAVTLALLCALAWAPSAAAEVNRCQRADGSVVYTDRRCYDIGAVERLPRARARGATSGRYYPVDCPRTVEDLRFQMTMAIDARDVNQLANVYHWVGVSSRGAISVMNRLEAVVQRPLVEIAVLRPQPAALAPPQPALPTLDPDGAIPLAPSTDAAPQERAAPEVAREQRAVALRVVQTLAGTATPSDTVYRLHRYFGCIWITR